MQQTRNIFERPRILPAAPWYLFHGGGGGYARQLIHLAEQGSSLDGRVIATPTDRRRMKEVGQSEFTHAL